MKFKMMRLALALGISLIGACAHAQEKSLTIVAVCGSSGLTCQQFSVIQNGPAKPLWPWSDRDTQHSVSVAYVGDNLVLSTDVDTGWVWGPGIPYYQVYDGSQPIVLDKYYCGQSFMCRGNWLFEFRRDDFPNLISQPTVYAIPPAVPEPSAGWLLLAGAPLLVARHRRRLGSHLFL